MTSKEQLKHHPSVEKKIAQDATSISEMLRDVPFSTVVILGSAGAGKSTLVERVAPSLQAETIMADEVFGQNPFFGPDKTDRKRWALSSNIWFLTEKFKLIAAKYASFKELPRTPKVVMDSGLTMGLAYARLCKVQGLYTPEEYDLFTQLSDQFMAQLPKPDVYIRLKTVPAELRQRVLQRGRQFEIERYTEEYLTAIDTAVDDLWKDLQTTDSTCLEYDL